MWLDHGEVRQIGASRSVVRGYLDSVNTKEAERAASESGHGPEVEVERQLPRRGSGELRITGVRFLDHTGAPSELLIAERTGTIRLHYTAQADCEGVVFTVGIDDANETVVTGMDNRRLAPWSLVAGSGTVDFVADPVLLAGGVYRLRVQVYVNGQLADAIDSDVHLTVRPPDTEQSGVFLQPGHWSMSHDRVVT